MKINEIFSTVSIDQVEFSPEREKIDSKEIDSFEINGYLVKKYITNIPVKIIYHIYSDDKFVGRVRFDITTSMVFGNKEYIPKSKCVTPHASLSVEVRGKNLVAPIYKDILKTYNLVSDKHTIAASKLWEKIGNVKYVTLQRGRLIEVESDDPRKLYKVILGDTGKL